MNLKFNFKDLILIDYLFVINNIKKNNFFYFLCVLVLTPFSFLLFIVYILFTFIYFIFYNFLFFYKKLSCFLIYKNKQILRFKFNNKNYNNNLILIILIFFNISKKKAFKIMYNIHKTLNEKKKFNFSLKLLFYFILSLLLRFLFIFLFYFNIKIFEISVRLLNYFIKYKKKNLSFKQYLELIFINFSQFYDSDLNDFAKNNKIIFDYFLNTVIFNPGDQVKILKSLLNDKFKLNDENLSLIFQCINVLKENSDLEYISLVQEVEKNYPHSFMMKNGKYYIGEKIPHTTWILPTSKQDNILIKETKSEFVDIKESKENIVFDSTMKTGYKSSGSIDKSLIVLKTPIINANTDNIYHLNNNKLLNNLLIGLTNKNDFVGQFLSSFYKPVYTFEKGSIFKDPKYLSFYDKIMRNDYYLENRDNSMQALKNLIHIWDEHFSIFKELPNSEIVDNVVKYCILQSDFVISPKIMQEIYEL